MEYMESGASNAHSLGFNSSVVGTGGSKIFYLY